MKYVLDTNIVSEIMKPNPNWGVISWIQDHNEDVYLNAISLHELYYGVYLLPDGKRKKRYLELLEGYIQDRVEMIFPFDAFAGYLCGRLFAHLRNTGRQGVIEDCMIAAICQRNDATLVTRNVKDFRYCDISLIDPFDYESETLKRLKREEAARQQGIVDLDTGDIDCVYHFALYELVSAVSSCGNETALETLMTLVEGKRLKDISDLPLDLSV